MGAGAFFRTSSEVVGSLEDNLDVYRRVPVVIQDDFMYNYL